MGFRRGGPLGGRSRRGPARPGARRAAPGTKGELARPAGARYAVSRGRSSSWKVVLRTIDALSRDAGAQ